MIFPSQDYGGKEREILVDQKIKRNDGENPFQHSTQFQVILFYE